MFQTNFEGSSRLVVDALFTRFIQQRGGDWRERDGVWTLSLTSPICDRRRQGRKNMEASGMYYLREHTTLSAGQKSDGGPTCREAAFLTPRFCRAIFLYCTQRDKTRRCCSKDKIGRQKKRNYCSKAQPPTAHQPCRVGSDSTLLPCLRLMMLLSRPRRENQSTCTWVFIIASRGCTQSSWLRWI